MATVCTNIIKELFCSCMQCGYACLPFEVVAFLRTNFIRLNSECSQALLSCVGPSNYSDIEWLHLNKTPPIATNVAAAMAILAQAAPPSLAFLRYICTLRLRSWPGKLPCHASCFGRAAVSIRFWSLSKPIYI